MYPIRKLLVNLTIGPLKKAMLREVRNCYKMINLFAQKLWSHDSAKHLRGMFAGSSSDCHMIFDTGSRVSNNITWGLGKIVKF